MDAFAEQKRLLLIQIESCRQNLISDLAGVQRQFAWIPRSFHRARAVSPYLLVAASGLGLLLGFRLRSRRRQPPPEEEPARGWLTTLWKALQLYRRVRPFVDGFLLARAQRRPQAASGKNSMAIFKARSV